MGPETAPSFVEQQISAIMTAPESFFGALLVIGFMVWGAVHFLYRTNLASKDSLISSKQGEIHLLERQLGQCKSDLEISQEEPAEMARVAANWSDHLREDFERLTSGEPLTYPVHPQSQEDWDRLVSASYLLRIGFANLQQPTAEAITIQSSDTATNVREEYDKLGPEDKSG